MIFTWNEFVRYHSYVLLILYPLLTSYLSVHRVLVPLATRDLSRVFEATSLPSDGTHKNKNEFPIWRELIRFTAAFTTGGERGERSTLLRSLSGNKTDPESDGFQMQRRRRSGSSTAKAKVTSSSTTAAFGTVASPVVVDDMMPSSSVLFWSQCVSATVGSKTGGAVGGRGGRCSGAAAADPADVGAGSQHGVPHLPSRYSARGTTPPG